MEPVKQPAISDLYGLTTLHMMMLLMTLSRHGIGELLLHCGRGT